METWPCPYGHRSAGEDWYCVKSNVLSGCIGLVGKLVRIPWWQTRNDATLDECFKALHNHWYKCHWMEVIQAAYVGLFRQKNNNKGQRLDSILGQGLVKNLGEDKRQLIRTGLKFTSWNTIQSSSFPCIQLLQCPAQLIIFQHEDVRLELRRSSQS